MGVVAATDKEVEVALVDRERGRGQRAGGPVAAVEAADVSRAQPATHLLLTGERAGGRRVAEGARR